MTVAIYSDGICNNKNLFLELFSCRYKMKTYWTCISILSLGLISRVAPDAFDRTPVGTSLSPSGTMRLQCLHHPYAHYRIRCAVKYHLLERNPRRFLRIQLHPRCHHRRISRLRIFETHHQQRNFETPIGRHEPVVFRYIEPNGALDDDVW